MESSRRQAITNSGKFKIRGDLQTVRRPCGFSWRWIVKDPLALKHFEFTNDEWFLLQQFDGISSLEDIKERYDDQFAPQNISLEALSVFLTQAHRCNLVLVDSQGQSSSLLERARSTQLRRTLFAPLSFLGMRFTLGDAQPILDWLSPVGRVLFHPLLFLFWIGALLTGGLLFVAKATQMASLAPELSDFLSGQNLWVLALLWMLVKMAHELGHGLACRKFGGECHEFGIQLIVFFPFAYCNVSDAWMMCKRWHRVAVSAAGMYVELLLATLGLYLWFFSHPGFFHSLMFNLIVLCSVNTLFFNGNPLLRFDGYYMLSDLWEVPNLHAQAKQALLGPLERWLLPTQRNVPQLDGSLLGLFLFGALAWMYRMLTITIIAWTLYHVFALHNLLPLAHLLILILGFGLLLPMSAELLKIVKSPALRRLVHKSRLLGLLLFFLGGLIAVLNVPWNNNLQAPVILRPQAAHVIYAKVPGTLTEAVNAGQLVRKGEIIATLRNLDLDYRVLEYAGRLQALNRQIQSLEVQVVQKPELAAEIDAARAALQQANEQLESARLEQANLIIRAPKSGMVLPPLLKPSSTTGDALGGWAESPLLARNTNCYILTGDLVCLIGEPRKSEAMLLLSQADVDLVQLGAAVRVRLEHEPGQHFIGKIVQIARKPVKDIPPGLAVDYVIPMRSEAGQGFTAQETYYYARVDFEKQPPVARSRSIGSAKIVTANQTSGSWLLRSLQQIFYFEL